MLLEALATRLPEWTWTEPKGGLSLWVRLPGADAVVFGGLAATLGVVVRPGPLASPDGGFRDHIRISYGSEPDRRGPRRTARRCLGGIHSGDPFQPPVADGQRLIARRTPQSPPGRRSACYPPDLADPARLADRGRPSRRLPAASSP